VIEYHYWKVPRTMLYKFGGLLDPRGCESYAEEGLMVLDDMRVAFRGVALIVRKRPEGERRKSKSTHLLGLPYMPIGTNTGVVQMEMSDQECEEEDDWK
jgi:hypothetical protein